MSPRGGRFDEKRERILNCATVVINDQGVRGASMAEVAAAVGMTTTNIAYYFGKKEGLAAACFVRTLDRLEALADRAALETDRRARLTSLFEQFFDLKLAIVKGEAPEIAIFSDIRTLAEPLQAEVAARYAIFFDKVQALFDGPGPPRLDSSQARARTNIVLEQMYWMTVWLPRYDPDEYARVCARTLDVLLDGVAQPDARWAPQPLDLWRAEDCPHGLPEALVIAATTLINERGYKGASIDMITAAMNKTKGAFYSHKMSKDDLLVAGFERTFAVGRRAQNAACDLDADNWVKLNSLTMALTEYQLSEHGPLMRTSALQSLPEAVRGEVLATAHRMARRTAGMISDGVSDGTLRAVDPIIAAQMVGAAINSAADRRLPSPHAEDEHAARHYAEAALCGVLSEGQG